MSKVDELLGRTSRNASPSDNRKTGSAISRLLASNTSNTPAPARQVINPALTAFGRSTLANQGNAQMQYDQRKAGERQNLPRVSLMDVVRELPGASQKVRGGLVSGAKTVAKETADAFVTGGRTAIRAGEGISTLGAYALAAASGDKNAKEILREFNRKVASESKEKKLANTIPRAIGTGIRIGTTLAPVGTTARAATAAGGLFAGGRALSQDKPIGQVATETAIGAGTGYVFSKLIGGIRGAANRRPGYTPPKTIDDIRSDFSTADKVRAGIRATVADTKNTQSIKTSDPALWAEMVRRGQAVEPNMAQRASDIATKLEAFRPGLGRQFYRQANLSGTIDDLAAQADDFLTKNTFGKSSAAPTLSSAAVTERSLPSPKSTGVKVPKTPTRIDKLNVNQEQETIINRNLEALGFGKRRVRTFEDMQLAAAELGTTPQKLFQSTNRSLSDSQVVGLRNFINEQSQVVVNAEKALAGAGLTTKDRLAQEALANRAQANIQAALKRLSLGGTESGRSVAAFRILANRTMEPEAWYRVAQRQLRDREFTPVIRQTIDEAIAAGDRIALARLMQALAKSSTTDKAVTLWKAGLLSNPATDIANISGNVFMAGLEEAKKIPATAFDKIYSIVTKKRTTYIDPLIAKEQVKGLASGGKKAWEVMRYGDDLEALAQKYDFGKKTVFDRKFWNGYTQVVFGRLGAEDALFREPALRSSIAEQALAQIRNEARVSGTKLSRSQLVAKFTELIKKPSEDMLTRARAEAAYRTFQSDSGIASGLGRLAQSSQAAKIGVELTAPFRRTPLNIINAAIDYSPFGVPKTVITALTNRAGAEANQKFVVDGLARAVTGTTLAAVGYSLAKKGLMTGLPANEQERAKRRAMGVSDNSIYFNGKWRRIDRFAPGSNILLLGANAYNQLSSDKPVYEKVSGIGAGILKTISEQSFLKGVSGMLKAFNDPERYAGSWVEQTIGSSIPALVGAFARGSDKSERNIDSIADAIKSRIPGARKTLTPQINVFGEERKQQRGVLGQIFNPVVSTEPDKTGAANIIRQADYAPGLPEATLTKNGNTVTLKGEEKTAFEKEMGAATLRAILSAPRTPGWNEMDQDAKARELRKLVDRERGKVRDSWKDKKNL